MCFQWNVSATCGWAFNCSPLALSVLVKKRSPRSSRPLSRTMRDEMRPSPSAVARFIAVGTGSPRARASSSRRRKVARMSVLSMRRIRSGRWQPLCSAVMSEMNPNMGPDALAVMLLDDAPRLLGVSALQGSGKSTAAAAMKRLAGERGVRAVSLSLDDFYLGHDARQALGREVHPLLATRGVPGTHDLHLLLSTLDALVDPATHWPLAVPCF